MRSDKPYYKLREKMYLFEVTQEELGKIIGRGPNYILRHPGRRVPHLFPPKGGEEQCSR